MRAADYKIDSRPLFFINTYDGFGVLRSWMCRWSSTIGDLFTYHGCCLEFTSQYFVNMLAYRNGGQTVRAVFE